MEDAGLAKSHAGGEEKHPATRLPSWSKQSGLVLQRNSKMISMIIDHDYKILVAQCDVIKQLVHLRSPTQDPARPFSQPGGKLPVPRDACQVVLVKEVIILRAFPTACNYDTTTTNEWKILTVSVLRSMVIPGCPR